MFRNKILLSKYDNIQTQSQTRCIRFFEVKELGAKELGAKELGAKELGAKELGAKELGAKDLEINEIGAIFPYH
jgi:hypothetical protein